MAKIVYNKKVARRQPGARTIRRAKTSDYGVAVLQSPQINLEKLSSGQQKENIEEGISGNVLSFEEVKKKLEEAVRFTRKEESERYRSSLKNLSDQLNAAKEKISMLENQSNGKDIDNYNRKIDELKDKLDDIVKKIIHGVPSSEDPKRPQINDKVFIDPIEGGSELDSHIEVDEESGVKRNIIEDIAKLKGLLNKEKK